MSLLTVTKWHPHARPSRPVQNTVVAPEAPKPQPPRAVPTQTQRGASVFHLEKGRRNVWPVEPVEELHLKETNWESVTSITILKWRQKIIFSFEIHYQKKINFVLFFKNRWNDLHHLMAIIISSRYFKKKKKKLFKFQRQQSAGSRFSRNIPTAQASSI